MAVMAAEPVAPPLMINWASLHADEHAGFILDEEDHGGWVS